MTGKPDNSRPEDEFSDDEDEMDNEQLDASPIQKILAAPFYLFIFLVWAGVAIVPFLILITIGWMLWDVSRM